MRRKPNSLYDLLPVPPSERDTFMFAVGGSFFLLFVITYGLLRNPALPIDIRECISGLALIGIVLICVRLLRNWSTKDSLNSVEPEILLSVFGFLSWLSYFSLTIRNYESLLVAGASLLLTRYLGYIFVWFAAKLTVLFRHGPAAAWSIRWHPKKKKKSV